MGSSCRSFTQELAPKVGKGLKKKILQTYQIVLSRALGRLKARQRCKAEVEENPLRPVAQVYDEEMTLIRGELGPGSTDLEEFQGFEPNFASLIPNLYMCFGRQYSTS